LGCKKTKRQKYQKPNSEKKKGNKIKILQKHTTSKHIWRSTVAVTVKNISNNSNAAAIFE
jgi:hypothetical protein